MDVTIVAARPRLAAASRRDARRDGRAARPADRRGQRQGLDGQPRRSDGAGRSISAPGDRVARGPVVTVRLLDTLTGETRPFVPLRDDGVRIYSCGPTVYGPAHIGNFRSFLFADLLVRHLRWRGYPVTWVMNITDIDDKIIRGAAAAGTDIGTLADRYLAAFDGGRGGPAHDDARRPAAGHRAHRRHRGPDRDAARARPRLPDRRRFDLLPDRLVAGVRPARAPRSRAAPGRGAGRGRRVREGRRPRLRALEGPEARRAVLDDEHRARAGPAGTSSARR